VKQLLTAYRVMATVVGVLLIILCLVGLPLHWIHLVNPAWLPVGSTGERLGDHIAAYLGVAHGWLYMVFVLVTFTLSRRARWGIGFTLVTILSGTVPILSFWAEHRATAVVRRQLGDQPAVPQLTP
jgi:integral membrane protein